MGGGRPGRPGAGRWVEGGHHSCTDNGTDHGVGGKSNTRPPFSLTITVDLSSAGSCGEVWRGVARCGVARCGEMWEIWGDWEMRGDIAGGGSGKADGGRSRGKVEGGGASSARCGQWLVGAALTATTVRECVAQQGGRRSEASAPPW